MKSFYLAFLVFVVNVNSYACKCKEPDALTIAYARSFDLVVVATIDSVSSCDKHSYAYIKTSKLIEGNINEDVRIKFDCSTSCQMSLQKGEEWVFYASREKEGVYKIQMCDRNRKKFADASEDYNIVAFGNTYEQEVEFLTSQVGVRNVLKDNNAQDVTQRENLQTSLLNKLVLVLISVIVFAGIIFFVKRMK
jgi:hypothetical protein